MGMGQLLKVGSCVICLGLSAQAGAVLFTSPSASALYYAQKNSVIVVVDEQAQSVLHSEKVTSSVAGVNLPHDDAATKVEVALETVSAFAKFNVISAAKADALEFASGFESRRAAPFVDLDKKSLSQDAYPAWVWLLGSVIVGLLTISRREREH